MNRKVFLSIVSSTFFHFYRLRLRYQLLLINLLALSFGIHAQRVTTETRELITDVRDHPGWEIVDIPLPYLQEDTLYRFFHSEHWGVDQRQYQGNLAQPFDSVVLHKSGDELFSPNVPDGYRPWITHIYEHDNGDLLGFLHLEKNTWESDEDVYRTGLGYSTDGGRQWRWCGYILESHTQTQINMKGCPYLLRQEGDTTYFYLYYNDGGYQEHDLEASAFNVARSPVETVLKAAAQGKVTSWKKYYQGKWAEPGLGGKASKLNITVNSHADIAYSTALDRYVLTTHYGEPRKILLYLSEDGLNWTNETVIDEARAIGPRGCFYYSWIVADSQDQAADRVGYQVGNSFYVYYGYSIDGSYSDNHLVFRTKVSLEN